jgi:tetratricopeptide (TPR) repeat protein
VKKYAPLFFCLFSFFISRPQDQRRIDSLNSIIAAHPNDTTGLRAQLNLGDIYILSDLDKTLDCEEKVLSLSTKLLKDVHGEKGLLFTMITSQRINALGNIGYVYIQKGEFEKALLYENKGLEACAKINDVRNAGEIYLNIGYISIQKGEAAKSIGYFQKALDYMKQAGYKLGQANALNNIGGVYMKQGNIPQALEEYQKSLLIAEELKDREAMGYLLSNIGSIHDTQGEKEKALECHMKSLAVREELHDVKGTIQSMVNIAGVLKMKSSDEALEYINRAVKLATEASFNDELCRSLLIKGDILMDAKKTDEAFNVFMECNEAAKKGSLKNYIARSMGRIGWTYYVKQDFKMAEEYSSKSLEMARQLGFPSEIRDISARLGAIYAKEGKYKEAYEMHILFKRMADSLLNSETQKTTLKLQAKYEYEKKAALAQAEQDKMNTVRESEARQNRIVTWASVAGLLVVIGFSLSLFQRFRIIQRQKKIIEEKSHLLEEKNRDITDSINYASRIQKAILRNEDHAREQMNICRKDAGRGRG